MLTEQAYAKINLFLDVTSRRPDGFHDIVSLMHTVSLCDTLQIEAEHSDKVEILIEADTPLVPTDSANLVYKAALAYLSGFGILARVKVRLEKKIPIGAGLAGGSADAAAVLRALNRIFGKATHAQLLATAAKIGSDVPFCLIGGTALCRGRGEQITPISQDVGLHLVIAIGESRVSTPAAYDALDARYASFTAHPSNLPSDFSDSMQSLGAERLAANLYNIFETVTDLPEIDKIKSIMTSHGALGTLMSGSGPAVFGIFPSPLAAALAADALYAAGFEAYTATSAQ